VVRRSLGSLVVIFILGGVAAVLLTNLETRRPAYRPPVPGPTSRTSQTTSEPAFIPQSASAAIEYPIGDAVEQNHMRIQAVWLPPVAVEGLPALMGADVIHLEADIHATAGNPNGFAKDEFVPYLKVAYLIVPRDGGPPIEGDMTPMVAADGLHYGASVNLPNPGAYRLIYRIRPPSEGGLGRHHDPITGVAAWWAPFEVAFDWDFPGLRGSRE
jgi:periplasmic iron binding protein